MKREELKVGEAYKGLTSGRIKTVTYIGGGLVVFSMADSDKEMAYNLDQFLEMHEPYDRDQELVGQRFLSKTGMVKAVVSSVRDGQVYYEISSSTSTSIDAFKKTYNVGAPLHDD